MAPPLFPRRRPALSFEDDYTKWLDPKSPNALISLSFDIEIDKTKDAGLYEFLRTHLQLTDSEETLDLTLSLTQGPDGRGEQVRLRVGDSEFKALQAEEVLNKIRNIAAVLFHDSAGRTPGYYWPRFEGVVGDLGSEAATEIIDLRKSVQRRFERVAKDYKKQLAALLGRLGRKYRVGMTVEQLNLEHLPYTLTLGDTRIEVPLEYWGSGTRNQTQILQALFRAKQISESPTSSGKVTPVLLLEEPESFLHPSAQARFARVLQELCSELEVQVIATTHSPQMLSHIEPRANILVDRYIHKQALRRTRLVDTSGDNWMEPFGVALGLTPEQFEPWRGVIFPGSDEIILVEGATDKAYLELLRTSTHGHQRLHFEGKIFPYSGHGNLDNLVLVKFVKEQYQNFLITFDMDVASHIRPKLESLGMRDGVDFLAVGFARDGMRSIEGLLPETFRKRVFANNSEVVSAALDASANRRQATKRLKELLFEDFRRNSSPGEDYRHFYALARRIEKAITRGKQPSTDSARGEALATTTERQ